MQCTFFTFPLREMAPIQKTLAGRLAKCSAGHKQADPATVNVPWVRTVLYQAFSVPGKTASPTEERFSYTREQSIPSEYSGGIRKSSLLQVIRRSLRADLEPSYRG